MKLAVQFLILWIVLFILYYTNIFEGLFDILGLREIQYIQKISSVDTLYSSDFKNNWESILYRPKKGYVFVSKFSIDADGSPHGYHPDNRGTDYLANAGKPGNWWGIVTDNNGIPVINKETGYYISTTSLTDPQRSKYDQKKYVNSDTVPFIVLSRTAMKKMNAKLGDMAFVMNLKNKKSSLALFADVGPRLGEGSCELARRLGLNSSPKKGGTWRKHFLFLVMPKTRKHPAWPVDIDKEAKISFQRWGGIHRINALIPKISL